MAYKEIVTKAVIGKGKKKYKNSPPPVWTDVETSESEKIEQSVPEESVNKE